MTKILITGGAGFIGSHLTDALLTNRENELRILDNFSSGSRQNIPLECVELIHGDVSDFAQVRRAAAGCDIIFHQAAQISVHLSIEQPANTYTNNFAGTLNVFEAARQAGVRRVVYASSAAVYGQQSNTPITESAELRPTSPYAQSKQFMEQLATSYNTLYGMECIGLRYMNVFGPRQRANSSYAGVIPTFLNRLHRRQPLVVFGDGGQSRDFIFVKDVVRANIHASEAPFEPNNAIFNIGNGTATTLNQLISLLQEVVGCKVLVCYGDVHAGDIRHSRADISRATAWGFSAETSLYDGLVATDSWLQRQREH